MTIVCFFSTTCVAGHVTIEVDELSDSQEKEDGKKSGGPGQFWVTFGFYMI